MAYKKQTWVDEETIINADRMNHIEDGIESVDAKCEYVYMDETTPVTKQYLQELIGMFDDGVKLIGVTPGINGYIYSRSTHKYRTGVDGSRYAIAFKYLTEYHDEARDDQFGYVTMRVSFTSSDFPGSEHNWTIEYDPIISVSDMALVVSTEIEGENCTFNETWQRLHDEKYTTVRIITDLGIYICPIVGIASDHGLYYVDFLTSAFGDAKVKRAYAEGADGYPTWNTRT